MLMNEKKNGAAQSDETGRTKLNLPRFGKEEFWG